MALTQQSNALYIFTKTMRDLLIFIRDKFVELFELIKVKTFEFFNSPHSNASSHALHLEFPEEEEDSSLASTTSDLSLGEINEENNTPESFKPPATKTITIHPSYMLLALPLIMALTYRLITPSQQEFSSNLKI